MAMVSPVAAQDQATSPPPHGTASVEVTPFVSIGSLAASRFGVAVRFPVAASFGVEVELGYRQGHGNFDAFGSTVSGLYSLRRAGRITPYLAAGAGLVEHGAPVVQPGLATIATRSQVEFTMEAGGGVQVTIGDRWSLRSDVRWFTAPAADATDHWRLYQGVSLGISPRK